MSNPHDELNFKPALGSVRNSQYSLFSQIFTDDETEGVGIEREREREREKERERERSENDNITKLGLLGSLQMSTRSVGYFPAVYDL